MKVHLQKQPGGNKTSVVGILLFLVAAVFMLVILVPNAATLVDKNFANGRIDVVDTNSLSVGYINRFDSNTYYLNRKIDSKIETYLKDNNESVRVAYSKYFPENAYLYDLERDKSLLSLLCILVISATAFFIVKEDLLKR